MTPERAKLIKDLTATLVKNPKLKYLAKDTKAGMELMDYYFRAQEALDAVEPPKGIAATVSVENLTNKAEGAVLFLDWIFNTVIREAMEVDKCKQCKNPDLKGIHTCSKKV